MNIISCIRLQLSAIEFRNICNLCLLFPGPSRQFRSEDFSRSVQISYLRFEFSKTLIVAIGYRNLELLKAAIKPLMKGTSYHYIELPRLNAEETQYVGLS